MKISWKPWFSLYSFKSIIEWIYYLKKLSVYYKIYKGEKKLKQKKTKIAIIFLFSYFLYHFISICLSTFTLAGSLDDVWREGHSEVVPKRESIQVGRPTPPFQCEGKWPKGCHHKCDHRPNAWGHAALSHNGHGPRHVWQLWATPMKGNKVDESIRIVSKERRMPKSQNIQNSLIN
jgi:hypothetical protein